MMAANKHWSTVRIAEVSSLRDQDWLVLEDNLQCQLEKECPEAHSLHAEAQECYRDGQVDLVD